MIKATEILAKALKKYVHYLSSLANGVPFERIVIPCDKKPSADFKQYSLEYENIISQSKEAKGYGYTISWCTTNKKSIGQQDLPQEISFDTEVDYLKFLKKEKEVLQFKNNVCLILSSFPELMRWIVKYPQRVIDNAGKWDDLLKVLAYFKSNPCPNLYIRELPVQVHTKFIETNKKVLKEMLDIVIAEHVLFDESVFEKRYHLKYVEPLLRLRSLDDALSREFFSKISDVSFPISQIRSLSLEIKNVFVVENQVNFLTFPKIPDSIVIWGHGYGVSSLKDIDFLKRANLFYWGDLDIQGFEILSQFRGYFPQTVSLLMDDQTFCNFYEGNHGVPNNVAVELNLTEEEYKLYNKIRSENLRLEQEKIPQQYLLENLEQIHLI